MILHDSNLKKKKNFKLMRFLQDTELWTQVNVKHLACQKIKLLLRCPLEFPVLVINSGFKYRIPSMCSPAWLIVALQTLRWASLNAALHSIPVIVTPCTEMVKGLWRWRRVHTQSIHTVNSVTRSKLVTYGEPQALIFHHTVAAGFYTVKQP